jgi:hypothetical protein
MSYSVWKVNRRTWKLADKLRYSESSIQGCIRTWYSSYTFVEIQHVVKCPVHGNELKAPYKVFEAHYSKKGGEIAAIVCFIQKGE